MEPYSGWGTLEAKVEKFFGYVEATLPLVRPRFEDGANRTGFAITLGYGMCNDIRLWTRTAGVMPNDDEKRTTSRWLSQEKILRPMRLGHFTSMQSLDLDKGLYGGGIYLFPWGCGISALKMLDDHCLAMAYMERFHFVSHTNAMAFISSFEYQTRLQRFLAVLPPLNGS